jgi:hypothetical protein
VASTHARRSSRTGWRLFWFWLALSGLLNTLWEIVHLPFYTLYGTGTRRQIAYAVVHCSLGDVLIAAATYAVAIALTRCSQWPRSKPISGIAVAVAAGVAYTGFSEWLNVYQQRSWAYADMMPQIFGIGLTPLLQWVVVPLATTYLTRGKQE